MSMNSSKYSLILLFICAVVAAGSFYLANLQIQSKIVSVGSKLLYVVYNADLFNIKDQNIAKMMPYKK